MVKAERLICAANELVEGGIGVRFEVIQFGAPQPAFVVRYRGQPRAYLNRCAHVPVEIDWQKGEFFDGSGLYLVCTTHGALYAPESGRCVGGKCNGKGLNVLQVEERDGGIFLIEEGGSSVR